MNIQRNTELSPFCVVWDCVCNWNNRTYGRSSNEGPWRVLLLFNAPHIQRRGCYVNEY